MNFFSRFRARFGSAVRAAPPATRIPKDLSRIVRPEAAGRWMLASLSQATPQYVESILRGAFSGGHEQQWELFNLMEDTWPRLAKNLNQLKRAVLALDWKIEAWHDEETPPTPEAEDRARLIERLAWTMRPVVQEQQIGFEGILYHLLDSWAKGISIIEIGWEMRQDRKFGRIIAPQCAWWVSPRNYGWSQEGWLGLANQVERGRASVEPFPDDKFLIGLCMSKTSDPLMGALLRPLAWWWCASNFSADWLLNLAQIFGLPIRWAQYDPSASQQLIDSICTMLENMGSAGWAAFPAGTQLQLQEPSKSGESYPQVSILDRADKQADLLVLGTTGTMDVGDTGTQALGTIHQEVQADVVQSAAAYIAGILNLQLIPSILRLNYGDIEECPEFCPEPKKTTDQKANAERDAILLGQGVPMPKAWFYERHQIPLPAEGEEVIEGRGPSLQGQMVDQNPAQEPVQDPGVPPDPQTDAVQAKNAATEKLIDRVLEDLSGVEAKWLGGVRPFFADLVRKAQSTEVSDAEFVAAIEAANRQMPELFHRLDHHAVAKSLEGAMGAAMANGALKGAMKRPVKRVAR